MFDLFGNAAFMAHGYCLLWQPSLIALHAASDLLIFLSYFAIPFAILRVLRDRPKLRFGQVGTLFAAFILLCGLTHLVGLVTLWLPIYELQGALKAITAIVSAATVATLFPLLPTIARMPDPAELETANGRLRAEIERHEATLSELESLRERLENTIEERTLLLKDAKRSEQNAADEALYRARSTLGIVQSLTRQTAAFAGDKDDFSRALSGRIAALASVLSAAGSHGSGAVSLARLVALEIQQHDGIGEDRVTIEGEDIAIAASAAQAIGLAVHELARSAVEGSPGQRFAGWIRIGWSGPVDRGDVLTFQWEDGGTPRGRVLSGLSEALLVRTTPIQLRGRAVTKDTGEGLSYTLTVPMPEILPTAGGEDRRARQNAPLFGAT